jgi:epoxyqueuosine reductase
MKTRRLLLHVCCGPCTIYPLRTLRADGWSVHGYFHNPNIQPYQELERRLEAARTLSKLEDLPLIVREDYDPVEFLRNVVFREEHRCVYCYSVRIEATARLARKSGFDAFSTTLLYSKLQKHDLITEIARDTARKIGVPFFYRDFRLGWREGQEAAKLMGIYRQRYCGCIYSEGERYYRGREKNRPAQ